MQGSKIKDYINMHDIYFKHHNIDFVRGATIFGNIVRIINILIAKQI
jgi:hypothetical protein